MNKIATMIVVAGAAAATANAKVTIATALFSAQDDSGTAMKNGTYVLLVDIDGDGFDGKDYRTQAVSGDNSSSFLWDADDYIVDIGQIGGTNRDGFAFPIASNLDKDAIPGYNVGLDVYVFWFDLAYDANAKGPGVGVRYGVENLGSPGTPPDGGTFSNRAKGGRTTLTTIPAPGAALMAVAGVGACVRRRR